jgi:hypothetical protein
MMSPLLVSRPKRRESWTSPIWCSIVFGASILSLFSSISLLLFCLCVLSSWTSDWLVNGVGETLCVLCWNDDVDSVVL